MGADMLWLVQMMKIAMGWFSSEPQLVDRKPGDGRAIFFTFMFRLLALSLSCCGCGQRMVLPGNSFSYQGACSGKQVM